LGRLAFLFEQEELMSEEKFDEKFVDPNTGETVVRLKIPEKFIEEIVKHVNENSMHANNFMQISRNLVALQIKQREEFDKATKCEQNIGKEVLKLRERMGLAGEWVYNIALRMMERREPPKDIQTLS
jgi:hypothetical protein